MTDVDLARVREEILDGIVIGMTATDSDPARFLRPIDDDCALVEGLDGRALARTVRG